MKIREIMTTAIHSAQPDTTLEEIATLMRMGNVGSVPIVEDNELIGIVTDRDIVVRCIAEGKHPAETRADDILAADPITIDPDSPVDRAAELMSRKQIRRLPVVENGLLVGMLSLGDIAVKQNNDRISGDTLEGVSRGVKQSAGEKPEGIKKVAKRAPARSTLAQPQRTQGRVVPIRAEGKAGKNRKAG
jgi:CBS domain-containing protein